MRLAALFTIDAFGGGFIVNSLLALWLFERFGLSVATAGAIFFVTGVCSALSYLAAARLAARIGLVNTMVFTHLPSSVLLILAALRADAGLRGRAAACCAARCRRWTCRRARSYVMAVVDARRTRRPRRASPPCRAASPPRFRPRSPDGRCRSAPSAGRLSAQVSSRSGTTSPCCGSSAQSALPRRQGGRGMRLFPKLGVLRCLGILDAGDPRARPVKRSDMRDWAQGLPDDLRRPLPAAGAGCRARPCPSGAADRRIEKSLVRFRSTKRDQRQPLPVKS